MTTENIQGMATGETKEAVKSMKRSKDALDVPDTHETPIDPEVKRAEKKKQKLEQKKALLEHKLARPCGPIIEELKPLFEIIRQKNKNVEEKRMPIAQCMLLIKENAKELAMKRESSRIIQSILAYCDSDVKKEITNLLSGHTLELAQSDYGKHVLTKLLKESPEAFDVILAGLRGRMKQAIKNKKNCAFLDELYLKASATKRIRLIAELFSQEYVLVDKVPGMNLEAIIATNPSKKETILTNTRVLVQSFLDRKCFNFLICQRVCEEYLSVEYPQKIREKSSEYLEHLEAMTTSSDGCSIIVRIIAAASAKERKAIIKTFKVHVSKLLGDADQIQILMAILSFVDDTVLVGKAIVGEFAKGLPDLIQCKFGRRIVLLLLAGRSPALISPKSASLLKSLDELASANSKKDASVRQAELFEYISEAMDDFMKGELVTAISNPELHSIIVEYANVCKDQASFLTFFLQAIGDLTKIEQKSPKDKLIRSLLKKSEPIADHIYSAMSGLDSKTVMSSPAAFYYVLMCTYDNIRESIKKLSLSSISSDNEAANLLKAKLEK